MVTSAFAHVNDRVFRGHPTRNAVVSAVVILAAALGEVHFSMGQHGFTTKMILILVLATAAGGVLGGSIFKLQHRSMMHDIILEVSADTLGARELLRWLRDPSKNVRGRAMREIARLIQSQP